MRNLAEAIGWATLAVIFGVGAMTQPGIWWVVDLVLFIACFALMSIYISRVPADTPKKQKQRAGDNSTQVQIGGNYRD